uniref:Uncharacterized protein n=1 Tax=Sinorhizobium meliloti (strain SM11) TaxID=707241 RepID=A4KVQ7_SINMM|nr:hypothetical protein [Sinorhizobium meliloti SM11]
MQRNETKSELVTDCFNTGNYFFRRRTMAAIGRNYSRKQLLPARVDRWETTDFRQGRGRRNC